MHPLRAIGLLTDPYPRARSTLQTYLIVPAEQQEKLLLSSPRPTSGPFDLTSTGSHHFVAVTTPPWSQSGQQHQQYHQPQQLLPYASAPPISFQRLSSFSQSESPFLQAPLRREESFTNNLGSALRREGSGRFVVSQGSGSAPGGLPMQLPSPPVTARISSRRSMDAADAPSRQLRKSLSHTGPNRPQSMGSRRFAALARDDGTPSWSALLPARPVLLPFPTRSPASVRPEQAATPAPACVSSAASAAANADQPSTHTAGSWLTTSHLVSTGNTGAQPTQPAWPGLSGRSTPTVPRVGDSAAGRDDPRVASGSHTLASHPIPTRGWSGDGTDPGVSGEAKISPPEPWPHFARLVGAMGEENVSGTMSRCLPGADAVTACGEALEEDGDSRGGSEGGAEQVALTFAGGPPPHMVGATGSAVFARRSGGSGGGAWLAHRETSAPSRMSRVTRVLREELGERVREESGERGGDEELNR